MRLCFRSRMQRYQSFGDSRVLNMAHWTPQITTGIWSAIVREYCPPSCVFHILIQDYGPHGRIKIRRKTCVCGQRSNRKSHERNNSTHLVVKKFATTANICDKNLLYSVEKSKENESKEEFNKILSM